MATISGQDFNRNPSAARRSAESEPVIITDRGEPAHVLMTIRQYQSLTGGAESLGQRLTMADPEDLDIPFEPGEFTLARADVDLS